MEQEILNDETIKLNNKKRKCCKACKIISIILAVLLGIIIITVSVILIILEFSTKNVKRIDDEGYLYYAEYRGNYESFLINLPMSFVKGGGCSAFISKNENGEVITGRNYDLPHKDDKKEITGLNVVLRLNKKGKYKSINIADAAWLSLIGVPYYKGSLEKKTHLFLSFLPYLCMDGINEKGLTASILSLDVAPGEKAVNQKEKKKDSIVITQLLRKVIDNCASVEEAIELTEKYNMVNIFNADYHLFVTDSNGKSVVLEWRNNKLIITYVDAATNFYVSSDDACDCYKNGVLKEKFIKPTNKTREYHYGYGHGFDRFDKIVSFLDKNIKDNVTLETQIKNEEAKDLLSQVSQEYTEGMPTSLTQYSVIYNNALKKLEVWPFRNYTKSYSFSVE